MNVDATDNGHYVSAYGAGLVQGASGQKLQFSVTRGLPRSLVFYQHRVMVIKCAIDVLSRCLVSHNSQNFYGNAGFGE